MMITVFALACFGLTASAEAPITQPVDAPQTECVTQGASNEEGILCKKYNDDGTLIAKCFICNCSKL